jgi:hypothetical protein
MSIVSSGRSGGPKTQDSRIPVFDQRRVELCSGQTYIIFTGKYDPPRSIIMIRKSSVLCFLSAVLALAVVSAAAARKNFEFGFHYGSWSLNLLKPMAESFAEDFAEQFKNKQFDKIKEENPGVDLRELNFQNQVEFDSSGRNFGFELRWYPAGENGSFSIGLALEKTSFKIGMTKVSTAMTLENMKTDEMIEFDGVGSGDVQSKPLAFLVSFRWDIFPRGWIHPYFTFGLGAAGVNAWDETVLTYMFTGTANFPGEPPQTIAESGTKTLLQLKEEDAQRKNEEGSSEEPFEYPIKFFPFLQLHFGLKAKITNFAHLLVDFGVLDGFVLRGGLAIRI